MLAKNYVCNLSCDKIIVSDKEQIENDDKEAVVTVFKGDLMEYISVIQKENHVLTYMDLNPQENWFVR